MKSFKYPVEVTDRDVAFGTRALELMPKRHEIPEQFKSYSNEYAKVIEEWFFKGLSGDRIATKEGIDRSKAIRHLKAIMGSFEPSHEHKIAGCAYLLAQWFDLAGKEQSIKEKGNAKNKRR